MYSIWGYVGEVGWREGSQVALRASVGLCVGLWRGGVKYCYRRLSGGLYGGLRAFLVFNAGGIFSGSF
jgi:hypothetical protein